jgi:endonuclease/exonuclease/phosphatase family metal-dependent hydrolase
VRLLLDEMISRVVAEQLRDRGWDVVAVQDPDQRRLRGLDDAQLFEIAQQEQRAVVTDNVAHFVECMRRLHGEGRAHYGLLLFTNATFPRHRHEFFVGALIASLEKVLAAHPEGEATSVVAFLRTERR